MKYGRDKYGWFIHARWIEIGHGYGIVLRVYDGIVDGWWLNVLIAYLDVAIRLPFTQQANPNPSQIDGDRFGIYCAWGAGRPVGAWINWRRHWLGARFSGGRKSAS
jgi:hypothetical protein